MSCGCLIAMILRCALVLTVALAAPAHSSELSGLPGEPRELAEGVWLFEGKREHFSRDNGGNIVNTGFIVTDAGVVVFDAGPSLRYGRAQRESIRRVTGQDVVRVYISHAHPDHFLGSGAYDDVPVLALPTTAATIRDEGEALTANLYLLIGGAMAGTRPQVPRTLDVEETELDIGGRHLRLLALDGHSDGDLALFDLRSGTLFAGDLVFFERAATTPNADIERWLAALANLDELPYKTLVPGHGPAVLGDEAIAQTRDYLGWLRQTLTDAAERGLEMNEVMRAALPEQFRRLAVFQAEWARSVSHLYPAIELRTLPVR